MSDVGCVGQVWENLITKHLWLLIGRDPDRRNEWKVFCLSHSNGISWAGDTWFDESTTKRIA